MQFARSGRKASAGYRRASVIARQLCEGGEPPMVVSRKEDRVMVVTLNRPKALNALCDQLVLELSQHLDKAQEDPNCGCIVITGEGRAFAAGADIKEMQPKTLGDLANNDFPGPNWTSVVECRIPVIAAVNGIAFGGGCELAMMCDMIVASDKALFGQPEIKLGVIPGAGGTQRLTKTVGKSKAMEICLTGDSMDAKQAEAYNLVSKVVPADQLMGEAMTMAKKIAGLSRPAVIMCKESVNAALETHLKAGFRFERQIFRATFGLDDKFEGMKAFVEKRDPKWTHK